MSENTNKNEKKTAEKKAIEGLVKAVNHNAASA
jgi:hypothetical protein